MLLAFDKVVHARAPERFKIEQMAGLFLEGPFVVATRDEAVACNPAKQFFQARGRAAKADAEIRVEIRGKMEFEFSFKPLAGFAHEESLAGVGGARQKTRESHTRTGRTNWPRCGEKN